MGTLRISVDEAKGRMDAGEGIQFLDTRAAGAWDSSDVKIPGAIRVDPHEVEAHLAEIPRDRPIVAYCT